MSRTAELLTCQQKTVYSLVMLIWVFCLVAHFLVEDVSLQRAMDPSAITSSTAGLAFDEIDHQDDLAMATAMPNSLRHNPPPEILASSIPLERQSAFPVHIPPKIA
jgi:hypothetical protein